MTRVLLAFGAPCEFVFLPASSRVAGAWLYLGFPEPLKKIPREVSAGLA